MDEQPGLVQPNSAPPQPIVSPPTPPQDVPPTPAPVQPSVGPSPVAPSLPTPEQTPAGPPVSPPLIPNQPVATAAQLPPSKPKKTKLPLLIGLIIIFLIAIGGATYALLQVGHKTTYQTVVQEFITAMQDHDKSKADALMSPAAKTQYQKHEGTSSIYTFCQKTGVLCTYYFTPKFLGQTTTTTKNYTFSGGVQGKEVTYAEKQTLPIGNTGCSSVSTSSLAIGVVPSGNTWLIYGADPTTSFSAKVC